MHLFIFDWQLSRQDTRAAQAYTINASASLSTPSMSGVTDWNDSVSSSSNDDTLTTALNESVAYNLVSLTLFMMVACSSLARARLYHYNLRRVFFPRHTKLSQRSQNRNPRNFPTLCGLDLNRTLILLYSLYWFFQSAPPKTSVGRKLALFCVTSRKQLAP